MWGSKKKYKEYVDPDCSRCRGRGQYQDPSGGHFFVTCDCRYQRHAAAMQQLRYDEAAQNAYAPRAEYVHRDQEEFREEPTFVDHLSSDEQDAGLALLEETLRRDMAELAGDPEISVDDVVVEAPTGRLFFTYTKNGETTKYYRDAPTLEAIRERVRQNRNARRP